MKRLAYLLLPALLAGCTTTNERGETVQNRTGTGAIIGAVAGAVVGKQVDGKKGAVIGAVVGGAAGAAVGNMMDKQEQEYQAALEQEQRNHEIEVERVREDLLKLTLSSEVSFDTNSTAIRPAFGASLNKIADVMNRYPDNNIMIAGHTDSVGSDTYNQRLSEQRAESVANYLVGRGVDRYRISTQGKGKYEPRASNDTAEGRRQNRRVEIFLQARNTAATR